MNDFRNKVLARPTPPKQVWLPEIKSMREHPDDPRIQEKSCTVLRDKVTQDPWLQESIIMAEGDKLAIKAMHRFSKNSRVQVECTRMMSWLGQWNWGTQALMGEHGALDAIVAAIRNFPDLDEVLRGLPGDMGALLDLHLPNRVKVTKLGAVDVVMDNTDKHYTAGNVLSMYCFWSTICADGDNAEYMMKKGEPQRAVRAMRVHKNADGVRGEVIQVATECFLSNDAMRVAMVQAGMITEVLSTLRDEMYGNVELDPIGKHRLIQNIYYVLENLASNATHRTLIEEAGAVPLILASMSVPDEMREGGETNLIGDGCKVLNALAISDPHAEADVNKLLNAHPENKQAQQSCGPWLAAKKQKYPHM